MLHKFLTDNRKAIFANISERIQKEFYVAEQLELIRTALSDFFDQIIEALENRSISKEKIQKLIEQAEPKKYGLKILNQGHSITQLVHIYGVVCESTTQIAKERNFSISAADFQIFNICLDDAVAEAVTSYEKNKTHSINHETGEYLGFLVHELRNAVTTAHLSFQTLQKGSVGVSGSVGKVLHNSLTRLRELIDRSLIEVRLKSGAFINKSTFRLADLINEVYLGSNLSAHQKNITISVEADKLVKVTADYEHVRSALSNLVHNAIKYTKTDGKIRIRVAQTQEFEIISVEDECGGIDPTTDLKELFKPFTQGVNPKPGLGLGLAICKKAIQLNGGDMTVKNTPPKGCIFYITLPKFKEEDQESSK